MRILFVIFSASADFTRSADAFCVEWPKTVGACRVYIVNWTRAFWHFGSAESKALLKKGAGIYFSRKRARYILVPKLKAWLKCSNSMSLFRRAAGRSSNIFWIWKALKEGYFWLNAPQLRVERSQGSSVHFLLLLGNRSCLVVSFFTDVLPQKLWADNATHTLLDTT